jgi:hypothetical protein
MNQLSTVYKLSSGYYYSINKLSTSYLLQYLPSISYVHAIYQVTTSYLLAMYIIASF